MISGSVPGRYNTKAAAVGNGSGQSTVSDPGHAALKHRIADFEHVTNL